MPKFAAIRDKLECLLTLTFYLPVFAVIYTIGVVFSQCIKLHGESLHFYWLHGHI